MPGGNVTSALAGFWQEVTERPLRTAFLAVGPAVNHWACAAQLAYAAAYASDPSPEAATRHAAFILESGRRRALEQSGRRCGRRQSIKPGGPSAGRSGDALSLSGRHDAAAQAYGRGAEYIPSNRTLRLKQARALVETGQAAQAEEILLDLLDGEERADALALLDRLWSEHVTSEQRLSAWQKLGSRYPDDHCAKDAAQRFSTGVMPTVCS